ncbi:amino acid permease [Bifidobacterium tissieri]|uniref:Amino acid permease n=2 Tax=Bifidobacterium tissieri TaxID=1630162 RepID=A0A5M9ZJT5_9BIFI|nr:amino acid permease [Bifidobacterium tissieri]KAA8827876.1 amino acid permease [Bifidobacterium tissieri]KAA8829999.1 amino acid permease [Bifidobacterium tissieri]
MRSCMQDVEELDAENQMNRGLKNRHVQFIAIGGTIGTGLFLGSGKSISLTGPSIIFVYIAVGIIMFLLMRAIGEMMYRDPSQHTFINFITRYLGRGWGHFAGWTYWIVLVLIGMSEITAVSTYFVTFFDTFGIDLSGWKWLIELCFLVALSGINLIAVNVFGEAEFWFSMIKITLICGMIATAVVMLVIGYHYPAVQITGSDHISPAGQVSLSNITDGFSLAPNGWLALLMSFQMVFFAYQMIEFIGVTVSETENPRKVLPKAINEIILRVLIFYVGALVAIMVIVPWRNFQPNSDGSFASPFIMVFKYAGLDWAAALVFFVVITAASSALNSLLYSAGRHLYQLAQDSPSPAMQRLGVVSNRHVPARAILVSGAMILLSPIINAIPSMSSAFVLFSSASSAVIIFIYVLTMVAHRRYRVSGDFMADGYVMPAYKFTNTLAIAFFVFVFGTLFISGDTRGSAIAALVWLIVFGGFCQWRQHLEDRDLRTAMNKVDRSRRAAEEVSSRK